MVRNPRPFDDRRPRQAQDRQPQNRFNRGSIALFITQIVKLAYRSPDFARTLPPFSMDLTDLSSLINALRPSFRSPEQQQLDTIATAWAIALGDHIAANAYPLHYERHTLTIAVRQSIWAQQLTAQTHQILNHLRPQLPPQIPIKTLRFRVAPHPCRVQTSTASQIRPPSDLPHPSRWPLPPDPQRSQTAPKPTPARNPAPSSTLQQTVDRWKTTLDRHAPYLKPCPRCHCLTPPAELDRWQICAVCATALFQSAHPLGSDRPAFEPTSPPKSPPNRSITYNT
ncbi:MAG: DUF721 domain-containing protein [Oscillatoriales cyanobacterium]|nr:MAG: DUF721 domain-containing protein [Oscillatoriales cyanobacterium]